MKIIKYSKPYGDVCSIKKDFYEENNKFLKSVIKINLKYKNQPLRKKCKNCGNKISNKVFFQFKIHYSFCNKCNHLNGIYEDTENFTRYLYKDNEGSNYYKYLLNNFDKRVKNIYLPKVNFLKKVIKEKISVIDIGSGAGHFLKALEQKNIHAIGYEPSEALVKLGSKKIKKNKIVNLDIDLCYKKILENNNSNTLSLIGVLEHLSRPLDAIKLYKKSKIKYLYISVPLFSLSVFLENSFKSVFPRQLSEGHTHLYTKDSLYYLAKKNNLKIIGEWWFGTDFADLHRSLSISSSTKNFNSYKMLLDKFLFSSVDKLQNVLDKKNICSQVHMIFKKK